MYAAAHLACILLQASWASCSLQTVLISNAFQWDGADERKHEFPACPLRWVKGGASNQLQNKRTQNERRLKVLRRECVTFLVVYFLN